MRGPGGRPLCLTPLRLRTDRLPLRVRRFDLPSRRVRTAEVLGGAPLLAAGQSADDHIDSLAGAILARRPRLDGLYFPLAEVGTPLWRRLTAAPVLGGRLLPVIRLSARLHLVRPAEAFDTLLQRKPELAGGGLTRNRLRLERRAAGGLRLERITRPEQVPRFLRLGGAVARRSWQAAGGPSLIEDTAAWRARLSDLAGRGLLRSYLLTDGEQAYSYQLGFQGRGVMYLKSTGYDPAFGRWSPGRILMHLQMQDLFDHDRPRLIHMGFGDDAYKRPWADESLPVANLFLLRRSLWSRLAWLTQRRKRARSAAAW